MNLSHYQNDDFATPIRKQPDFLSKLSDLLGQLAGLGHYQISGFAISHRKTNRVP